MRRPTHDVEHLERRLRAAERLATVGAHTAGVVHDLGNPVGAALMNLELLQARLGGAPTDVAELLRDTRVALDRVMDRTRELRRLAETDEAEAHAVDVVPVLESCLRMLRVMLRGRARLVLRLDPVPPVAGSEGRLAQVLLNLLTDAALALPEGRAAEQELVVGTTSGDGRVVVSLEGGAVGGPVRRARVELPVWGPATGSRPVDGGSVPSVG